MVEGNNFQLHAANLENDEKVQSPPKPGTLELFQKRWFCAALLPSGKTFKQDAETPMAFIDVLSRATVAWIDYVTTDIERDFPLAAAQLAFGGALISSLSGDTPAPYLDFDTEMGMRMPCIQIRGLDVKAYPLLLLLRKNFVFTSHTSLVDKRFTRLRRYADSILKKTAASANAQDKLTMVLMRIIDANGDSNFRHLRVIEERGDELNEDLMNTATPREKIGPEIYMLKHALITYMNALWDSVDVLHALRYGDAELLTDDPKLLDMMTLMAEEVKSQIGLAEHMSEVIASGLEVMQTIYNNQLQMLNNRLALVMTYLTIVGTAVLVPNTLATILGNAVFEIGPEDLWWYIILMVVLTLGATYLVYWWVKRRGWIPRKVD